MNGKLVIDDLKHDLEEYNRKIHKEIKNKKKEKKVKKFKK